MSIDKKYIEDIKVMVTPVPGDMRSSAFSLFKSVQILEGMSDNMIFPIFMLNYKKELNLNYKMELNTKFFNKFKLLSGFFCAFSELGEVKWTSMDEV